MPSTCKCSGRRLFLHAQEWRRGRGRASRIPSGCQTPRSSSVQKREGEWTWGPNSIRKVILGGQYTRTVGVIAHGKRRPRHQDTKTRKTSLSKGRIVINFIRLHRYLSRPYDWPSEPTFAQEPPLTLPIVLFFSTLEMTPLFSLRQLYSHHVGG